MSNKTISARKNMYIDYMEGRGINEGRVVLHSDMNNFFASVECMLNPALAEFPVAVCGSEDDRHGIVLAKNFKAKFYGIQTAEPVRSALRKCPKLVVVPPHYDLYLEYSRRARQIYSKFTDRVEPFGADEAWLELTGCYGIKGLEDGILAADEIRECIKRELGLTVSVGVSDNKAFAKLGSDFKKPDATSLMSPLNYAERILPMRISELIFAGPKTTERLARYGLYSFADVVRQTPSFMNMLLGINGERLLMWASGFDTSRVMIEDESVPVKSIGNSFTAPRDIVNEDDVRAMLSMLSEMVGLRLRKHGFHCSGICVSIRTSGLLWTEKQVTLDRPTDCTRTLFEESLKMFQKFLAHYLPGGIRSMGIRCISLKAGNSGSQFSMFDGDIEKIDKLCRLDRTVDSLRARFGKNAVHSARVLSDSDLVGIRSCEQSSMRSSFHQEL